jgi:hypothetical protein
VVVPGESVTFAAVGGTDGGYVWTMASAASGGTVTDGGLYTSGALAGTVDVLQLTDLSGAIAQAQISVRSPDSGDAGQSAAGPEDARHYRVGCGCSAQETSCLAGSLLILLMAARRRRPRCVRHGVSR